MNVTLNSVLLPDDLVWRDEFEWAPVEQVVTPTLSGVPCWWRRPPSPRGAADSEQHAPAPRCRAFAALEVQVAQLMTLTLLDGVARTVRGAAPGVVAMPLVEMADPEGATPMP